MNILEATLSANPSQINKDNYTKLKSELEKVEKKKTMGAIIRSKAADVEYNEKASSYFLKLEKRNSAKKHIKCLELENGHEITDPSEILLEEMKFYKKLYSNITSDKQDLTNAADFFLSNITPENKLGVNRNLCEKEIIEEISKSIKDLPNKKSPGSDGFSADFYKFFWIDIKDLVFNSINYALNNGILSIEQRRAVLSLNPKNGKNIRFLKNWRPISLLNTDYKIIAKLLAKRLQVVLPFIISSDQSGYLEGRNISNNLRNILDIIDFTKKIDRNGMIIFVDFEKAFDTVRWDFLQECLEKFNFGPFFRHCVNTLYTNISTCVTNNGHSSPFFNPERGIRQGCPLSALLFILVVEVLSIAIKTDKNISGINIGNKQFKITQLADDTTLFLHNVTSLQNVLKILDLFKTCSGLKINREKSEAIWIGASSNYRHKPCGLKWTDGLVKCLGILMHSDMEIIEQRNLTEKIQKIENLVQIWYGRPLSLKGKITVIQSIFIAQIIYPCSVLFIPDWFVNHLHTLFVNFLWNHKTPKVKHTSMIADYEFGGLRYPDVKCKIAAIKLCWIQRLFDDSPHAWKECLKYSLKVPDLVYVLIHSAPKCNALPVHLSNFYKQIFSYWHDFFFDESLDSKQIESQPLWFNSHILIDNKPVWNKHWYESGIVCVKDLLSDTGKILSMDQLILKYQINTNFLEYLSLISAIPYEWKQNVLNTTIDFDSNIYSKPSVRFQHNVKCITKLKCKDFYWSLIQKIAEMPSSQAKWISKHNLQFDDITWNYIYMLPHSVTIDTHLQSLQFKILHRIFPCGTYLSRIGKECSKLCIFCNENKEDDIMHYFCGCKCVKTIWQLVSDLMFDIYHVKIRLGVSDIIFGIVNLNEDIILDIYNYVILQAKNYIYICKKENSRISISTFYVELKHQLDILKIVMYKNNKVAEFNEKWQPLLMHSL